MSEDSVNPRSIEALVDEGHAALEAGDLDNVLSIAAELKSRRHSCCFELEARARWEKDEREQAIAVLEEGVAKAPGAAPLWHWLGCYRSDLGRCDAALEAFAREAEFEHPSPGANAYNVAVVYERMGRPRDALDLLDRLELPGPDAPSAAHFKELRARLLFEDGDTDGSVDAATRAIDLFIAGLDAAGASNAPPPDWSLAARAFAVRADGRLRRGDRDGATDDALRAIDIHPAQAPRRALDVLRRADARPAINARRLKLLLQGELPPSEEHGRRGFFVSAKVVADDDAEALEFARRFVREEARDGLTIEELTDEGAAEEAWKGVYWCSPLHVFDPAAREETDERSPERIPFGLAASPRRYCT
jgi:tetratricopeptide (TPR) repeat protein